MQKILFWQKHLFNYSWFNGIVDKRDLRRMIEEQGSLVRSLKGVDSEGDETKAAIAKLLDLQKAYKEKTGQDWLPESNMTAFNVGAEVQQGMRSAEQMYSEIEKQGNLVRELKAADSKSIQAKEAIVKLLELKKSYKDLTGQDYKPRSSGTAQIKSQASHAQAPSTENGDPEVLYEAVKEQGDLVRKLKATDPKSSQTKEAISKLLELKKAYKELTGQEYTPRPTGATPSTVHAQLARASNNEGRDPEAFYKTVEEQGNLVRSLKAVDPKSAQTKEAIAKLLELKKSYKGLTGQEYKPRSGGMASIKSQADHAQAPSSENRDPEVLYKAVEEQGDLVRSLKAADPKSSQAKEAISKLLELKKVYKELTGQEYKPRLARGALSPVQAQDVQAAGGESRDPDAVYKAIEKQGNLVRSLKAVDPKSAQTKEAIDKLLELKKTYKNLTGSDYNPRSVESGKSTQKSHQQDFEILYKEVEEQGNLVRALKAADPKSDETKIAIAKLSALKEDFKKVTGQEYKPGQSVKVSSHQGLGNEKQEFVLKIDEQDKIVRALKAKDPNSVSFIECYIF